MDTHYNIIIIGAGTAGLAAATFLAKAKKKVLVLERNKALGLKVCAGGLTIKDFTELNLPKSIIEKEFKHINLHIGNHKAIKLQLDQPWIWTCSRENLAQWQLDQAKSAGAEIRLGSSAKEIYKNRILTDDNLSLHFDYLIGADGSGSLVRNFLGLKTKKIMVAIQYCIPDRRFKELEIFFDLEKFGPVYAWIFPHQDYVSVGTGCDPKFIKPNRLKTNLDSWCQKLGIDSAGHQLQAAPISYDYKGVDFGNVFLVGDAAGLASGLTGEGIHPAMVSGIEAAKKIINPDYRLPKIKQLVKNKRLEETALGFYKTNKTITKLMFGLVANLLKNEKFQRKTTHFLTER
ncbi:MAG: NAD(P)/FAD-dependent oxidoreductase [Candidatus Pacebacteria bacterium]|nr:NAD(P)/FAD-dependent oxidoreductase [Candidatus Paceibacterota bacterium]